MDREKFLIAKLGRVDMSLRAKLDQGSPMIVKFVDKGAIFALALGDIVSSISTPGMSP